MTKKVFLAKIDYYLISIDYKKFKIKLDSMYDDNTFLSFQLFK